MRRESAWRRVIPSGVLTRLEADVGVAPVQTDGHATTNGEPTGHQPQSKRTDRERPRSKGGRPKGRIDPAVARRNADILEAWRVQKFGANKAEYARQFCVDRKTIYEVIG
jgi:hypothetical protein